MPAERIVSYILRSASTQICAAQYASLFSTQYVWRITGMDRILVTETIAEAGLEALRAAAQVDVRTDLDKQQLLETLPDYDALIVRSATKVTADVIRAG